MEKHDFRALYNEFIKTKRADTEDEAEQLFSELWDEVKYHKDIARQILDNVRREYPYRKLPPLSEFIKHKKILLKNKFVRKHYPESDCSCIACLTKKHCERNQCLAVLTVKKDDNGVPHYTMCENDLFSSDYCKEHFIEKFGENKYNQRVEELKHFENIINSDVVNKLEDTSDKTDDLPF